MATCIRIEWDSGTYEVQNVGSYSYQILDPYFAGCKRYNVYAQFRYKTASIFSGCVPGNWILDSRRQLVNGTYYQNTNSPGAFNPTVELIANLQPNTNQKCNPSYAVGYRYDWGLTSDCTTRSPFYSQIMVSGVVAYELVAIEYYEVINNNPPPIKLKITDGGVDHLYSITNKNSVVVIPYDCSVCPPNTLDCGDCCLPCDEVFNSISDIRRLISRLN